MYHKDLFKDWSPNHLEDCGWYIESLQDCTPPFEVALKESHEFNFQEKLASSRGLDVQASKKQFVAKAKGKKTIPQEIVELLRDVTMVDYEVTTLKRDLNDPLEKIDMKHSSKHLDLSQKSRRPSLFQFDSSFGNLGEISSFNLQRGC
jgi:hypothetical protein